MTSINGYQATNTNYQETSRGIAYSATIIKGEEVIGHFENKGDGGSTQLSIDKKHREDFKQAGLNYFDSIGFNTEDLDDHSFDVTIAEHLIEIAESGKVSQDVLDMEWMA